MDKKTVLSHGYFVSLGRFRIEITRFTNASLKRNREMDEYCALAEQVRALYEPHIYDWAMEDLWNAGGNRITAMALMRRMIDGSWKNPWATDTDPA